MTIVQWRTTEYTLVLQVLLTLFNFQLKLALLVNFQKNFPRKSGAKVFFVIKECRQILKDASERTLYLNIFKACVRFTLKNSFGELETGCSIFVL